MYTPQKEKQLIEKTRQLLNVSLEDIKTKEDAEKIVQELRDVIR
ncbi:MAG: hypothetical protein Q9M89_03310 [Persephonella sp.]|nr:hypothetical protein [Persephonella sp.]